jgi:hypothetical protein
MKTTTKAAPATTTKAKAVTRGRRKVMTNSFPGGIGLWIDGDPSGFTVVVESRDFHRNGIGGEPFYVLAIRWHSKEEAEVSGRAIVTSDSVQAFMEKPSEWGYSSQTFVLANDSDAHYRGDNFGELLVPYLAMLERIDEARSQNGVD